MTARLATAEQLRGVPFLGLHAHSLTRSVGKDGEQLTNAAVLHLEEFRQRPATSFARLSRDPTLADIGQTLETILAAYRAQLPSDTLDKIHARLSVILNPDERETSDALPNVKSFRRMVQFLAGHRKLRTPSVFVNRYGLFNASWRPEKRRLASLVFQPGDDVSWLIFLPRADDPNDTKEAAGRGSINDALKEFKDHDALEWMSRPSWIDQILHRG